MKNIFLFIIVLIFVIPFVSFAHPGRTDFNGGHTCKTNCSNWGFRDGEYHVHTIKVKEVKTEAKKTVSTEAKLKSR